MTITYDHVTTNTAANSTFNFASENFGTPSADRYIIVAITTRMNGTGTRSLTSATIGGINATKHVELLNTASNGCYTAIISANVSTGSSGTIALTFSGGMIRTSIAVYIATGMNGTPTGTNSTTTDNSGLSVAFNDQGVIIGVACSGANAAAAAWTNLAENYDATMSSDTTYAGAQSAPQSGSGSLTCTCDFTTATTPSYAYVSFEPSGGGGGATPSPTLTLLGVGN